MRRVPNRTERRRTALILLLVACAGGAGPGPKVDFNRDVRPILSDKCFACHGPDEPKRKAKLRLDTPEGMQAEAASGSVAVVPGKPDESELYVRIASDDPEERMPPAKSGKSLTEAEAQTLKAWIEQGAPFQRHWAFVPPKRPALPDVRNKAWCRNPIDAFILARLEKEGLAPSPEAEPLTRFRRLSLDLVGLPPTLAELDAALRDSGPDAEAKLITRLLDAPAYGERWGRLWLDAARYADSDGYEKDKLRQVWAYRDWVIQALNRDLPYDQFLIEQIAGDLLPNATQDQIVATGFLRNSMINEEGGVDPEQFRMEAMFDRMEAIGKGVLGLTIQCAQCHSHKFDPLTHEEYYKMFAYVNETHEANVSVYSPREQAKRADLFRQIREIEAELQGRDPEWARKMADWEARVRGDQPEWTVVEAGVDDISTGGQKHQRMDDGSLLAGGYAPTKFQTKFTVRTNLQGITAFRLELLNDPNLPLGGPGRSIKGTGALTEFLVDAAPADGSAKPERIKIVAATADVNPPEAPLEAIFDDRSKARRVTGPIEYAIDGKPLTAWTFDIGPGRRNLPRKAVFVAEKPISHSGGSLITFYLNQSHGGWNSDDNQNNNLGRFRFSITTAPTDRAKADPLPKGVREILSVAPERRTPAQVATVFSYWRTTVPEWSEANARIESLWREHPEGASQLVLKARETPRMTHLLERGDFLKPGKIVAAGVPGFLHELPPGAPATRLTFARWLADRNSPTTARSIVNRVWQAYFGTGLVSTSEDLGTQSEPPSHPELLDWLAVEFMEQGWSLKKLHRLIVSSATYRQSSKVAPEALARDPYNRLLARGPRFRVDAEVVRDIALASSGLLSTKVGGPSVFPPAPEFLFQPPTSYGPKVWPVATGDDRYRRALYTFRYRSVPFPMLQTFDSPNGDVACVRRVRSNTPLQALTALNEPTFLECARALALRTLEEGGETDSAQLAYAFRRCVARPPTEREATLLLDLLHRQESRFAQADAKPWELAAADPNHPPALPKGATPGQLAAWTAVSRVLLNLDETITKE